MMQPGFIYPGSPQAQSRAQQGQFRPISPDRYVPVSLRRMREQVAAAIAHEIVTRNIKAADIIRYLPSIRKSDVDKFRDGFGDTIAERKLFQIAEAIGLRFGEIEIKGVSK